MFEGIKAAEAPGSRLDMDFEFEWFLQTIEIDCAEHWNEVRNALFQLFCGAMRVITDYRWIPECKEISLSGIEIRCDLAPDENGRRGNNALGKWTFYLTAGPGKTTKGTIENIEKDMERFLRARFTIKEPTDLNALREEYERKILLEKILL